MGKFDESRVRRSKGAGGAQPGSFRSFERAEIQGLQPDEMPVGPEDTMLLEQIEKIRISGNRRKGDKPGAEPRENKTIVRGIKGANGGLTAIVIGIEPEKVSAKECVFNEKELLDFTQKAAESERKRRERNFDDMDNTVSEVLNYYVGRFNKMKENRYCPNRFIVSRALIRSLVNARMASIVVGSSSRRKALKALDEWKIRFNQENGSAPTERDIETFANEYRQRSDIGIKPPADWHITYSEISLEEHIEVNGEKAFDMTASDGDAGGFDVGSVGFAVASHIDISPAVSLVRYWEIHEEQGLPLIEKNTMDIDRQRELLLWLKQLEAGVGHGGGVAMVAQSFLDGRDSPHERNLFAAFDATITPREKVEVAELLAEKGRGSDLLFKAMIARAGTMNQARELRNELGYGKFAAKS